MSLNISKSVLLELIFLKSRNYLLRVLEVRNILTIRKILVSHWMGLPEEGNVRKKSKGHSTVSVGTFWLFGVKISIYNILRHWIKNAEPQCSQNKISIRFRLVKKWQNLLLPKNFIVAPLSSCICYNIEYRWLWRVYKCVSVGIDALEFAWRFAKP